MSVGVLPWVGRLKANSSRCQFEVLPTCLTTNAVMSCGKCRQLHIAELLLDVLVQKHKGRLSGSLDVANRGAMDRMMSTPLAAKERGITHRISRDRADFWKEEQNQPKDKKDNHTGMLPTVCCMLPTVYSMLPTVCCMLPTLYSMLPTVCCMLPTVYPTLPTVISCCLLSTPCPSQQPVAPIATQVAPGNSGRAGNQRHD